MKWIRAQDLERWADSRVGIAELSGLIGQLVRASAQTMNSFRFPSGDSAGIPGYDGHLVSTGAPPYVPDGESVWEFGTGRDYLAKANEDYQKRTNEPRCVVPAKATFVFVTPRQWKRDNPTLTDWEVQKRAEGIWKEVRAIDGIALEDWLEQHEAVAASAARELLGLVPPSGVRSVDKFWEEYASRFRPILTEQVLLCGRTEQADHLLEQIGIGGPQTLFLQADSGDEVVAFVTAAIRAAAPELRNYLEARTLILDTEEAARHISARTNMIFIVRDPALGLVGALATKNPTVVPLAREDRSRRGAMRLERPSSYALGQALATTGMPEEVAQRLARECGRSVTILARRVPSGAAVRPSWDGKRELVPAMLAGGWNAAQGDDRKALALLAGIEYEDFEDRLTPFLRISDPLEREGTAWKVRAPVDAFIHLGCLITSRDMERLRTVATDVFAEVDPALDLPRSDRPYAALTGKKMRHSEWLRDGLATTLLHIAVLHNEAGLHTADSDPKLFVENLIDNLPGLKQNWRLLASLQHQLPLLMEAAPRPLLAALEQLLEGDGSGVRPIFEEYDAFFPSSSHTHVLWALELLAWDPSYLPRVTLDLGRMARVDPGGRLQNRPINSLREIFRPWKPETNASMAQRLASLDQIIAKEPEIGWQLVKSLLPERHGYGTPTSRPRLREAGASERETLTRAIVNKTHREIVSRALELARNNSSRMLLLVQKMAAFDKAEMMRVCDGIEKLVGHLSTEQQKELWGGVRDEVNRHLTFHDAEWAFPPDVVERLRTLQNRIEPSDTLSKVKWLFDDQFPELPDVKWAERLSAADQQRVVAARELFSERSYPGIVELAQQAGIPWLVGIAAAAVFEDLLTVDRMIEAAFSSHANLDVFLMALSNQARTKFGQEWTARLTARASQSASTSSEQLATLVLAWDDEPSTWNLVAAWGPQVEQSYWSRKRPGLLKCEARDLERAARKYLSVGRAVAAIHSLYQAMDQLPGELIFELLDRAIHEIASFEGALSGTLIYELEELFDKLDHRNDLPLIEVARREYAYLPLLRQSNREFTLHRLMVQDPSFFVSVLCDSFKPSSGEEAEPSEEKRTKATLGYQLLSSLTLVPGFDDRGDGKKLRTWVDEVRRLAAEHDRAKIADQYIGQVLAHVPNDPEDAAWPHRAVRDVLESLQSDEIENGIAIGRSNMLGVHAINPKNPAAAERHLAAQARKWAETTSGWPQTSAMLMTMASQWEWTAANLEERARQDAMRD